MANRAREIREEVQQTYPGAAVSARGRNWIEHTTAAGRRVIDAAISPLHIAGTEIEIDTAWQPTTGAWQYRMIGADYNAYARSQLNAGDAIQYVDPPSGQSVTFQPLALNWINHQTSRQQITQPQSVMATVQDDTLHWPNGYGTGRHFTWRAQNARLQKLLTIDSAAALPAPANWLTGTIWLELEFILKNTAGVDLWIDGVRWARTNNVRVQTASRIEFRLIATGQVLWMLDLPRAWDAAGRETIGQFELRRQSSTYYVTVRVPKTWIDGATYPIYLDPTIDASVGTAGNDGHWWEGTSDFDANSSYLLVGNGAQWGRGSMNGFARFTGLADLQGTTIDNAYFRYTANESFSTAACRLRIRAVAADNPAAPTTYTQAEGATRTTAYTDWTVAADVNNTAKNSPDIADVIQEVVDRSGFGGAIIIYLEDNGSDNNARRYVGPYDWSSTAAPVLHVEYTEGGGSTVYDQIVAGSLAPSGALVRRTDRALAGALTAGGTLSRRANKTTAGVVTAIGSTTRRANKVIAGIVASAGLLRRETRRALAAVVQPTGALARTLSMIRALTGSVSPSGVLSRIRVFFRALSGALTPTGLVRREIRRALSGAITPSGVIRRETRRALSGVVQAAGILRKNSFRVLGGIVTASGNLLHEVINQVVVILSGIVTASGALRRETRRGLNGIVAATGALARETRRRLAGSVQASGALLRSRAFVRLLGGAVAPAGVLAKTTARALAGSLSPTGALAKITSRALSGAVIASGALTAVLAGAGGRASAFFRGMFRGFRRGS